MKNKPEPTKWSDLSLLTKREVAKIMQVSPRFLERMVKDGRLRAIKISSRMVRFRASDIDAFLEAGASWYYTLPKKLCQPIGRRAVTRRKRVTMRQRLNVVSMTGPTGLVVEIVLG